MNLLSANGFLPSWVLLMGLWMLFDSLLRPKAKFKPLEILILGSILFIGTMMSRWPLILTTIAWWSVYAIRTWRRVGKKEWTPWEKRRARLDHIAALAMVVTLLAYEGVGYHTLWYFQNF